MTVERKENELVVRVSTTRDLSKVQAILDYLRYEELTAECTATDDLAQQLAAEAKKGRWERSKNRLPIHE